MAERRWATLKALLVVLLLFGQTWAFIGSELIKVEDEAADDMISITQSD